MASFFFFLGNFVLRLVRPRQLAGAATLGRELRREPIFWAKVEISVLHVVEDVFEGRVREALEDLLVLARVNAFQVLLERGIVKEPLIAVSDEALNFLVFVPGFVNANV